jgi:hypothetical protein
MDMNFHQPDEAGATSILAQCRLLYTDHEGGANSRLPPLRGFRQALVCGCITNAIMTLVRLFSKPASGPCPDKGVS